MCLIFGGTLSAIISQTTAASVENDPNSYIYYKQKIGSALQDMEREFRVNNTISDSALSNVRNLLNEAYLRLPDSGEAGTKNEWLKKAADLYIDLAAKNKNSSTHVQNAAAQVAAFVGQATISEIVASIDANPTSGNAPLTSSFLASGKDPSGINIPDNNFTWWMKESGWARRELWRGPSFTYTFSKEWNYQVFLDVVSQSLNKKWKPDVISASISKDIEVKPRLGNVTLLVNWVNVSNLDTLKVSPSLGKIGLLFDASASRAISNGTIVKTKWDFWNGNIIEYEGSPVLERQLYVNPEMYKVSLEITTNQGNIFRKQLQLLVRDPAAVISLDRETAFIGEEIPMSAKSYLANMTNVEYNWEIQDIESWKKTVATKKWSNFNYKFTKVWQYIVSLTTRSPNGSVDTDSRIITIESRPPIINLDSPRQISTEKPNTLLFDASRSYDPDTNNGKWLMYEWLIDGEKVELNDIQKEGAIGSYTFSEKWSHTVSLTITNAFGKVSTVDKTFNVTSTLTIWVNITPRAAPIGSMISFQARSPQARFYEWNLGDGSPTINWTTDFIQNVYKKTGIYTATLNVKNGDGSEENTIWRKIYITDTDSPFALIDIKSSNGSVFEDPDACENPGGAFVINRAESTTLDWGNSINVDGNSAGLSYTWKYMDRVKTWPSISEKFTELWCFPIELTVRSDRTWASHTSTRFIEIKNIGPKVTSVTATIDPTKKDTQKIIASVVANGARDDDGVIRSYIWFYTTENDSEKQNVRITQSPTTSFVLPNVTEKYYFWVIIEDNDGARYDSSQLQSEQLPLIVANDDQNINMPLINLSVVNLNKDRGFFLAEETVEFSASAKTILNIDVTDKSEYYWDFDGDSRIDQKTTVPQASHKYKQSGKYNMKVKVVNNGISNTKYQVIYVKNELKAAVAWYRIGDMTYFINTSKWTYDSAKWIIWSIESSSPYGTSVPNAILSSSGSIWTLTIKSWTSEISTIDITPSTIEDVVRLTDDINIQSHPALEGDTIKILNPGDKLLLSMHGNNGDEYRIDSDTKIDSDLDAIEDNDVDNKDTPSFKDGSIFSVENISESKVHKKEIKVSIIGDDGKILGSKKIQVIFDYIPELNDNTDMTTTEGGSWSFSVVDKENLEKLQAKIRTFTPEDRIIFTQYYNNLIESWGDSYDRTEWLLTIQKEVLANTNFDDATKTELSSIIDVILVWDAQATNEISVASRVIEWLVPTDSANRPYIIERLEKIKANPGKLVENKVFWKEILEKIQSDPTITTENKLIIKSQLLTIVNGGQESIPEGEIEKIVTEKEASGGILWFISGTVNIFLIVIWVILVLFLIGFIVYRFTKKKGDMGFQDFLIDSVAHANTTPPRSTNPTQSTPRTQPVNTVLEPGIVMPVLEKTSTSSDPLASIGVYNETMSPMGSPPITPVPEASMIEVNTPVSPVWDTSPHAIPDWLKPVQKDLPKWNKDDSDSIVIKSPSQEDPLTVNLLEERPKDELIISPPSAPINSEENTIQSDWILPDFHEDPLSIGQSDSIIINNDPFSESIEDAVKNSDSSLWEETSTIIIPSESPETILPLHQDDNSSLVVLDQDLIPDWLKPSSGPSETPAVHSSSEDDIISDAPILPSPSPDAELPDWLKNSIDNWESSQEFEEEKSEITETPKPKAKAPKKTEKKPLIKEVKKTEPKKPAHQTTSSNGGHDIPDWLK